MCRNPCSSRGRGGRRRQAVPLKRRLSFCRPDKTAHIAKLHALAARAKFAMRANSRRPTFSTKRPPTGGEALRTKGYRARSTDKSIAQLSCRHPPASGRERHDRALGAAEEADDQSVEADLHGERRRPA